MSRCSENAEKTCKSYPNCDGCNAYGNKTMTDNEIKQALPFLAKYCKNEYNDIRVDEVLLGASDLINRQEAKNEALQMENEQLQSDIVNANMNLEHMTSEIERLKKANEKIISESGHQGELLARHYESIFETAKETAKSEAIKEFAERVELEIVLPLPLRRELQNLVKEMVGEG
jgi:hypothetical protein